SSRRRHTRSYGDWSSDVCSSDLHVDRDADRPGLVRDGARDGLPDPPRRVGRELVTLAVVELLDRADETDVPFLDQVEEAHAAARSEERRVGKEGGCRWATEIVEK